MPIKKGHVVMSHSTCRQLMLVLYVFNLSIPLVLNHQESLAKPANVLQKKGSRADGGQGAE